MAQPEDGKPKYDARFPEGHGSWRKKKYSDRELAAWEAEQKSKAAEQASSDMPDPDFSSFITLPTPIPPYRRRGSAMPGIPLSQGDGASYAAVEDIAKRVPCLSNPTRECPTHCPNYELAARTVAATIQDENTSQREVEGQVFSRDDLKKCVTDPSNIWWAEYSKRHGLDPNGPRHRISGALRGFSPKDFENVGQRPHPVSDIDQEPHQGKLNPALGTFE